MEKGHYGKYTGNARHSRKEEMIHDREMIYDAKTQIHNEDKKYKETGKDGYKKDMIHERELIHDTKSQLHHADSDYKGDSPAHYSYSSKFGSINLKEPEAGDAYRLDDGGADAEIKAMNSKQKGMNDMIKTATDVVGDVLSASSGSEKKKTEPVAASTLETSVGDAKVKGVGFNRKGTPSIHVPSTLNPRPSTGGGSLSSFDTAWQKDYDRIRTSGMYGGSGEAAKARYIADVGGQGETKNKANARSFAQNFLAKGVEYNPNTMGKYLKGYNKTD